MVKVPPAWPAAVLVCSSTADGLDEFPQPAAARAITLSAGETGQRLAGTEIGNFCSNLSHLMPPYRKLYFVWAGIRKCQ